MGKSSAVKLKPFKDALYVAATTILGASIGEAIWSDQGVPRPDRPYLEMRMTSGPSLMPDNIDDQEVFRVARDSIKVTLDEVTDGRQYRIRLNGRPALFRAGPATTVADARDVLVTLLNAIELHEPSTTASGIPDGELTATADTVGGIYSLEVWPASSFTVVPSAGIKYVLDRIGTRLITVTFDVFSSDTLEQSGAIDILSTLLAGFQRNDILETLRDERVGFWGSASDITNLTGVASVKNEGRAAFDLRFVVASRVTAETTYIETVSHTHTISA